MFPASERGQEAGSAEGDRGSTRERVPAWSRPALSGTCARSREGRAAQSPGLCNAGPDGELVTLLERILPPRMGVSERRSSWADF